MYEFVDRLVNIALPRVRDFRGLNRRRASTAAATTRSASRSTSSSPRSTTTRRPDIWGMDITVCTSAKPDDEARALLDRIQLPVPAVRAEPSNAESQETLDGEEEFDREEQPAARG